MNNLVKQRRRKWIILAAAVILTAAACLLLRPWYLDYMERDHRATCEKARFVIEDRFYHKVDDLLEQGVAAEDIDYLSLLREAVRENVDAELGEDMTASGICRSGGTYTFFLDPETHRVRIACDYGDHGTYEL